MLYGRDVERSAIGELLAGAREYRSGVLVLRGEAGIGKSALLAEARRLASDVQVLECHGVQSEVELSFAALHQLVRPILGELGRLPRPQARALRTAFGLEDGASGDRFLISLGTLSLLAEAAERGPLLCLVDDAHWLDDASADALIFVARRLAAEGIAMIFAARDGEGRQFDAPDLSELRPGGLEPAAAAALVEHQAGQLLPATLRDRLVAGTGGNPLALLELPSALSEAQLAGEEPLFGPLPVGSRVEHAFLERARRLPDESRAILLLAASDDSGRLGTVIEAGQRLGVAPGALDAAETAGLVSVSDRRIAFRHPLVRSAVYQGSTFSQRQAAHLALAEALKGDVEADRRAWHRAAATAGPDAAVADELERAAARAKRISGFGAASLAFERAASLSPEEESMARRLAAAAENAWGAGQPARALTLLARARPLAAARAHRADMDRLHGLIEMAQGLPSVASGIFAGAAAKVAPEDAMRALYMLNIGSTAAAYAFDRGAHARIAGLARELPGDTPLTEFLACVVTGVEDHFVEDFPAGAARLRRALELVPALEAGPLDQLDPLDELLVQGLLLFAGRAALFLGDERAGLRLYRRAVADARAIGSVGILAIALPRLAVTEVWAGRFAAAAASADEALHLSRESGQDARAAFVVGELALVAGLRGEEERCRTLAAEGLELAAARRLSVVSDLARWGLLSLELGLGRQAEAYARAQLLSNQPVSLWAGLDRVEAAVRAGERDVAVDWLDRFEAWAASTGLAWAAGVALHGRALLAEGPDAERLFLAALEAHSRAARPYERARCELAFGAVLRRGRRRVEAREHLRAALEGFEDLGAGHFAERARAELRASGQSARRRDPSAADRLTPQELQVASFVAQGLSNREVAGRLFLSPRTIDFHLRNVYAKLGIASRGELAQLPFPDPDEGLSAADGSAQPSVLGLR